MINKYLYSLFCLLLAAVASSQAPFSVSTFHNISIYWSPNQGAANLDVLVKFKKVNATVWADGLNMEYNPIANVGLNPATGLRYDKADYRGSIVNLTPNTTYDIQLTLEGTAITESFQATTWSEDFPIGQIINIDDMNSRLSYDDLHGTEDGYILIDGTGSTIDVQDNADQCIRLIDCSYLIIRGFTLINGSQSGVRLFNSHHIVIENCDISNWGDEDIAGSGFGVGYRSGIQAGTNDARHCVFQRNKIHHPRWDTNSWAELHDPASDPELHGNYHPNGPQGISLGQCYIGNNVIRYNEIWSDTAHYFNDIMGMWSNASYAGFPGADSDIYGNYLANCFDDGIESEGNNMNVRIWNNYIEEVFLGIGNAATSIGPLYIWRNVSGRTYSPPTSVYGDYGGFLKMGFANSIDWMTGKMFVFNNTILQPNDQGCGGLGTHHNSNRVMRHCTSLNNILHVRTNTINSISTDNDSLDNYYDFDLLSGGYPVGSETHGIVGVPTYETGAPSFDFASKTGNFKLQINTSGYDEGTIIPNFCVTYQGDSPDMGAHENGWESFEYGTSYTFNPLSNYPPISINLRVLLQGPFDSENQLMNDNLRVNNLIPLEEPYTTLGFEQVNSGGETIEQSILNTVGNDAIVDWVLVELRDPNNPSIILATQPALLQRDGDVVNKDGLSSLVFSGLPQENVYLSIQHRNHFGVRTLNTFLTDENIVVDFTDLAFATFGLDPMTTIGNVNVLIAGDANNDGQINPVDKNDYWRTENGQPYDYFNSKADFNLDGVVNPVDKNGYWRVNNSKIEQLE